MPETRNPESLFHEARALWGEAQARFLSHECGGDLALRAQVEALLAADAEAGSFLQEWPEARRHSGTQDDDPDATIAIGRTDGAAPHATERPGQVIGRYKLLQQIGEGGFGSVWMAEQREPVVRKVALKIIKLGMDTRQVIARFEAERQALALMDHPNIAKVLDAGATDQGRPFFVMELVRGVPITRFADENKLDVRERLDLLVQVCRAVQHAHTKGIIHRDIKPGNVLVTMHDDRPAPTVIDFGIAKAMHERLTDKTLFTRFQQFIGTPAYMSPEQAQMSGLDVDTRSDIYSLGVLMYELLTGTTPFDSQKLLSAGYDELRRVIREDDPPKPSTRISSALRGPHPRRGEALRRSDSSSAAAIASLRGTDPRSLVRCVRGELDWVVMKALEKNRTRRYETANGMALDIERYLRGEAVSAAPATPGYRARKFLRRHRLAVGVASVVAVSMLAGLAMMTVGFIQARAGRTEAQLALVGEQEQRQIALHERDRARDYAEELRQQLYVSNIETIQRIIATDGLDPVRPLLDACDADLRAWEWNRLSFLADRSEATLPTFGAGIRAIEYSADGDALLIATTAGEIHILDARSLAQRRLIGIDPPGVGPRGATFSRDGKRVAASDGNRFVHVWDVGSGRLIRSTNAQAGNLQGIALDETGARVALGAWFDRTRIFDVSTGEQLLELPPEASRARVLRFTRDGARLLVGSLNNSISMVDAHTGALIWSERGAAPVVTCGALGADETLVATAGIDGRIWLRRAHSGRLLHSLPTGKGECNAIAFHPDGELIALGANDGLVTVFLTYTGEKLFSFRGHAGVISALDFDPQGRFLLSGDATGVVKRWHLGSGGSQVAVGHHNQLTALAFAHDDRELWFGGLGSTGGLQRLRFADMHVDATDSPSTEITSVAVSPDGSLIASACSRVGDSAADRSGRLVLLDVTQSLTERWSIPQFFQSLAFSPDAAGVVGSSLLGSVAVFDTQSGRPRWLRDERNEAPDVNGSIFSRDGRFVLNSRPEEIRILDAASGETVRAFAVPHRSATCLALAADGVRLFAGGADGVVRVWDWQTGTLLQTMTSQPGAVTDMKLFPGETRLVTGADDGSVRLWAAGSGRQVMLIGRHNGRVSAVAVSHDGATIASCGHDNKLLLWETRPPMPAGLDARLDRDRARRSQLRDLLK